MNTAERHVTGNYLASSELPALSSTSPHDQSIDSTGYLPLWSWASSDAQSLKAPAVAMPRRRQTRHLVAVPRAIPRAKAIVPIRPVVSAAPEPGFKRIGALSKILKDDTPSDYHGPPIGYSIKAVHHKSSFSGFGSVTTHGDAQAPRPVFSVLCSSHECSVCMAPLVRIRRA